MRGKIVVVTGANSGIGRETSLDLAGRGARVVMVCRNPEKGRAALAEVEAVGEAELVIADLSSLVSVRAAGAEIAARHPRIDVLMNNAGVYLPKRIVSVDGFEMTFATNHLGPFLLTQVLRPCLAAAKAARVVTVSSAGHRLGTLDLDDLNCTRGYSPVGQYGVTKLQNILFTRELARRGTADGIIANCFHPGAVATGWAQDEPGVMSFLMKAGKAFLRSPARGARTGIYLATSDDAGRHNGEYFRDERPRRPSAAARDDEAAARLWVESERLIAAGHA